ncbi:hypothetical protein AAG906_035227 [Vitis piasezkii]
MDVSLESKSLPSVGNSRKSYPKVTSRGSQGKLVHFHGWKSLALPSVSQVTLRENDVCGFRRHTKGLRNHFATKTLLEGCVGFHLEVPTFHLVAYIRGVKLKSYHAYLELLVARFDDLRYFLRSNTYPEVATAKDRRALRNLATRFVICGDTLYRRSADGVLLDERGSFRSLWSAYGRTHASPGHEFILVAIDYFTKWVEAASYARLTSARVASFIRSHIICRYGVPHELISDRGVRRFLRQWAQARFDQLNLLDERRLRADHVQAYQRKMARAFKKRVKPRPLQKGDLVLRILKGLIGDPRGKFRPIDSEGAAWLTDLDGNQFSEPTNVDQLKKYYFIEDIGFIIWLCIRYPYWGIFLFHLVEMSPYLFTSQLDIRLSTGAYYPLLDEIASLHGFVEIEMDRIGLFSSLLPYRLGYPNKHHFVHFEIFFK